MGEEANGGGQLCEEDDPHCLHSMSGSIQDVVGI